MSDLYISFYYVLTNKGCHRSLAILHQSMNWHWYLIFHVH